MVSDYFNYIFRHKLKCFLFEPYIRDLSLNTYVGTIQYVRYKCTGYSRHYFQMMDVNAWFNHVYI